MHVRKANKGKGKIRMRKKCMSLLIAVGVAGSNLFYPYGLNEKGENIVCYASSYQISENGIALIKSFEGFLQYAQWDYSQWSIGYGTGVNRDDYPNGITEAEADSLLREVVVVYEKYVRNFLDKYGITVTQNQYDALVSFTYNLGNVWSYSSEVTIRTYLINGIENYTHEQITDAFKLWCKAGGEVLPGLLRRREQEAELFLSGTDYSAAETGEKWRVTSSTGIRLRNGHSTSDEILNVIPYNQTFKVEEKVEYGGFLWGKTSYSGTDGWCVLDYADRISGNLETEVISDDNQYEKWTVTSETGLNLRYNHGLSNTALAVIPFDTEITVYEKTTVDDFVWGRTEYDGEVGWCVLNYAKKTWPEEAPESIIVKTLPNKTEYLAGELFDNRGMTVAACYSDGSEELIEDYGCTGNTMIPGISTITVEYQNMTCSFTVSVWARSGDINKNGTYDFEDSLRIKEHILNCSQDSIDETGDINGDGVINVFDSIKIKKEILSVNK